ncbi:hypothetical protein D3C79_692570 [compost metagenome]
MGRLMRCPVASDSSIMASIASPAAQSNCTSASGRFRNSPCTSLKAKCTFLRLVRPFSITSRPPTRSAPVASAPKYMLPRWLRVRQPSGMRMRSALASMLSMTGEQNPMTGI